MALLLCVMMCENIVIIDNSFYTQITKSLSLGFRLAVYVDANLRSSREHSSQAPPGDPLSFAHRPCSTFRSTYDCTTCKAPYEVLVDETGFLNRPRGLCASHDQLDLFIAGDSVLQGLGVPRVMEVLRDQFPGTMWNLSIARAMGLARRSAR
jgi:hypothetical protein